MDCIDCHNRAAHKIPAPDQLIDDALAGGRLDAGLPYLKREALRLLGEDGTQPSPEDIAARWAQDGWFDQLAEFYQSSYPALATSKQGSIQKAVVELKRISGDVLYPAMKTSWLTYPDNRGHPGLEGTNTGCFRCHTSLVNAKTGERMEGGAGGTGCLACHDLGEKGESRLGGDPIADPACAYCHVPIPLRDLERGLGYQALLGQ